MKSKEQILLELVGDRGIYVSRKKMISNVDTLRAMDIYAQQARSEAWDACVRYEKQGFDGVDNNTYPLHPDKQQYLSQFK